MKDAERQVAPASAFSLNIRILENPAGSGKAEMLVTLQKRDKERGAEGTLRDDVFTSCCCKQALPDLNHRHALSYGFAGQVQD